MDSNEPKDYLMPYINKYLKDKSEEVRDYGDYWSASSAGMCQRLLVFRRLKLPKVPELNDDFGTAQRNFGIGHAVHGWVQGITKATGISVAQEQELQDETYMIRGHYDDVVKIDGKYILIDYKTVNSKAFGYPKKEMGQLHRMQLGTYLMMLQKDHPKLVDAMIYEFEKDNGRYRFQSIKWDNVLENDVKGFWRALNASWGAYKEYGEIPDCTCHLIDNGWMAKRTKLGKVYNDYFFNNEPCSLEWFARNKENINV